jgi:uncharacterized membrane protein
VVLALFIFALAPAARVTFAELESLHLTTPRLLARVGSWRRAPLWISLAVGAFYAVYMSYFTVRNHQHFNTLAFDLGIYDNQFWQALHGHPMRSTTAVTGGNWSVLCTHAEFSMYVFLPFYALAQRAETLLVLQSVFLATAVLPIHRLIARRVSPWLGPLVVASYVLYPPLQGANFYDFHFQPLAAVFVLYTLDFIDERRWWAAAVTGGLALGCREDISIGLACFGLWAILTGYRPRVGALMLGVSAVYFVVLKFVVMPRFGPDIYARAYQQLFPTGEQSFGGVIQTLITNPWFVVKTFLTRDKLLYALQALTPLAFLPLRGRLTWLLLMPGALFTILATQSQLSDIGFQYSGHYIPYAFFAIAAALGRSDLSAPSRRAAALTLACATAIGTAYWGAIPPRENGFHAGFGTVRFAPVTPQERSDAQDLAALAALVPRAATLAVSEQELPHVSARPECVTLRYGAQNAEYALYRRDSGRYGAQQADEALRARTYHVLATRGKYALLQRGR